MKGLSSFLLETFLGLVGLIVVLFIIHAVLYPKEKPPPPISPTRTPIRVINTPKEEPPSRLLISPSPTPIRVINTPTPTPKKVEVSDLKLSFQTNKTTYNVGDKVVIHVQATQSCYLKIFNISSEGKFYQLVPSQQSKIRLLEENVSYQIPRVEDKYDWIIGEGLQGTESLFAVCTLQDVDILPSHINDGDTLDGQEFEQMLKRNLEKLPHQEWSLSSSYISILTSENSNRRNFSEERKEERKTSSTIPQSDIELSFQTNKTTYNEGDKMVVHLQATQSCYLKIFNISSEGKFYQLVPSRQSKIRLLKGNVSYQIPGTEDRYDWATKGTGTESLFAVCTLQNVNILQRHIHDGDRLDVQEFEQILTENLEKLPRQDWTLKSVQLSVK